MGHIVLLVGVRRRRFGIGRVSERLRTCISNDHVCSCRCRSELLIVLALSNVGLWFLRLVRAWIGNILDVLSRIHRVADDFRLERHVALVNGERLDLLELLGFWTATLGLLSCRTLLSRLAIAIKYLAQVRFHLLLH